MKNLTISRRLVFMVVGAVLALAFVGIVGLSAAIKAERGVARIRDDTLASVSTLGDARSAFQRSRVSIYTHVLSQDDALKGDMEKRIKEFHATIDKDLVAYEKMLSNDDDRRLLEADRQAVRKYYELFWALAQPKSRKNDTAGAFSALRNDMRSAATQVQSGFDKHVEFNEKLAVDSSNEVVSSVSSAIMISVVAIAVSVVAIAMMGFFTLSTIRSALNHIRDGVGRIETELDFTQRVTVVRQDEIGLAATALNRLLDKLQQNLQTILARVGNVAQAANQMSTTSDQVAAAAHQQSEAAVRMAAVVEEMTVSISHVDGRANEANRMSSESGGLATSGEATIGRTVGDINKIASTVNQAATQIRGLEAHSQKISSVVAVIKEVADQTNLLALNAAIEAARAGEQGRGFAVVADEVRKLAERTSASTQEIAQTIASMRSGASEAAASMDGVVSEVDRGVESAREASIAIGRIGEGSRGAVDMVAEISAAIRTQVTAMSSIAGQVERIAQMSEESSSAADNSAQIARNLDALAAEMQEIVSAYRI